MTANNAEGRQGGGLSPQSLRLADLARILTALGTTPISAEMIERDIGAGAPANPDGTINLVHYAAWLVKEMRRGD